MQFKAEYQLSSDDTEIKYTQEAFLKMLSCDSVLKVDTDGTISFDDVKASLSLISAPSNDGESHIYACTVTVEADCKQIESVSKLFRRIRKNTEKISTNFTVLWDDVSFHACKIAYDVIYVLENTMRKLVNTFMIHVAGVNWVDRSVHHDVKEIMKKAGEERNRTQLFALDFIHLSWLIFRPYSNSEFHSKIEKLKETSSKSDLTELREIVSELIPRSNWERHFVKILHCEPEKLKKDWQALYELRCKVAHNADFNLGDLKKLRVLEKRVSSVLDDAIKKVQEIKVSPSVTSDALRSAEAVVKSVLGSPKSASLDATSLDPSLTFHQVFHEYLAKVQDTFMLPMEVEKQIFISALKSVVASNAQSSSDEKPKD